MSLTVILALFVPDVEALSSKLNSGGLPTKSKSVIPLPVIFTASPLPVRFTSNLPVTSTPLLAVSNFFEPA